MQTHRAPTTCPVCSTELITLRLGCPSCGTELSGHFESCRYARLDAGDAQILEVFLRGRGNIRDLQAHLGVSYPTARARLGEVLDRLGFTDGPPQPTTGASPGAGLPAAEGPAAGRSAARPRMPDEAELAAVLADLAAGRLDVAAAEALLERQ